MHRFPKKAYHKFNGQKITLNIIQHKMRIKEKKSSSRLGFYNSTMLNRSLKSSSKKFNFIRGVETISQKQQDYILTFEKNINLGIFRSYWLNPGVEELSFIYEYQGVEYLGTGSLIILAKEGTSESTVASFAHKNRAKPIKRFKKLPLYLLQYRNDYYSNQQYEQLLKSKPDWISKFDRNYFTMDLHVPSTDEIFEKLSPNLKLPNQYAYRMINLPPGFPSKIPNHFPPLNSIAKIKVGILDSGIDGKHPDILESFLSNHGYDYVENDRDTTPYIFNSHGTNCAGLIAGKRKYTNGVDGVSSGCKIVDYRIAYVSTEKNLKYDLFDIISAFYHAAFIDKVDIINCSWSIGIGSSVLKKMIKLASKKGRKNKRGTTIVFSAGNKGEPISFPANMPEVITVSATDENGKPKIKTGIQNDWGSNYSLNINSNESQVDIAAPGIGLITTDIRGIERSSIKGYHINFGRTSSAAPQVSGCIALMLAKKPTLKPSKIKKLIKKYPNPKYPINPKYGAGILDVNQILTNL